MSTSTIILVAFGLALALIFAGLIYYAVTLAPADHPMRRASDRPGINRRHFRASAWLLLAALGATLIGWHFGGTQYLASWAGVCAKAASGAWGGYWISRNVVRCDPSARSTPAERIADKACRAFIVGAVVIAVCLAV